MNFNEFSKKYKPLIDKEIDNYLSNKKNQNKDININYLYLLIQEYVKGGKRLRPLSLILSYLANGGKDIKKIVKLSISVELLHAYTLILDDIMDEDEYRRGVSTITKDLLNHYKANLGDKDNQGLLFSKKSIKFSVSTAMMIGNITRSLAFSVLNEVDISAEIKVKLIKNFNKVDELIYHGQFIDVWSEHSSINQEQYINMIKLKTGVLFELCFSTGTVLAGVNENIVESMKMIGQNTAAAFQIQDDLIDINLDSKKYGSDIINGKKTLLYIIAKKVNNDIDKYYGINDSNAIKRVVKIMNDSGAVKECQKLALSYLNTSKELIKNLDIDLVFKETMLDFCDYVKNRIY